MPALVAAFLLVLAGCASEKGRPPAPTPPTVPGVQLHATTFTQLPDWENDHQRDAWVALQRSCIKFGKLPSSRPLAADPRYGRAADWQRICAAAVRTTVDDLHVRRFFEAWFTPYVVINDESPEGLFTGYYEPLLHGSWWRHGPYQVPLYRKPPVDGTASANDLPSRAAIRTGALDGRGLELLYVDDDIDAFFLEIQGSGRIQMDTGERIRVGFAGKNGYGYFPIGRALIQRGEIPAERMSMQAIRTWLRIHPDEAPQLMDMNPAVVFFRIVDGDGPIGAQGVALTPGRSIAVDPTFVPYGTPVWLDTTDPLLGDEPLRRLLIAQDTGAAIKGPIRGDVFWGSGDDAEARAGLMKQPGRWYLLLPRAAVGR